MSARSHAIYDDTAQDRAYAETGTVFQQGLGLFGSAEDAALLDEVVAIAYEERRHSGGG